LGGVERVELGVEINLFQLIHQDHRRIPVASDVARRDGDTQALVGSVAELLHDRAGLRTVLLDVGVIPRQRLQHVGRHPQSPLGNGCIAPPISPSPAVMMSMNDLRSRLSDIARRKSGLSKGGAPRLTSRLRPTLAENIGQTACGAWFFDVLQLRHRHAGEKIRLSRHESQQAGRDVFYDRVFDTVEMRLARFPVIWVLATRMTWLGWNSTSLNGPCRSGGCACRARDVAGIDWRPAVASNAETRLCALEVESDFEVAV